MLDSHPPVRTKLVYAQIDEAILRRRIRQQQDTFRIGGKDRSPGKFASIALKPDGFPIVSFCGVLPYKL
jgi:hypothetical protein